MSPVQRSCLGCLTVLVLLVLAGGGGYYGVDWWVKRQKAADPTNARNAEVGDCLVKSPTPEFPDHMVIGRCRTRGSYGEMVRVH